MELNEWKFENLIYSKFQGISKMQSSQRLLLAYVLFSRCIDFYFTWKLVFVNLTTIFC